MRDDRIDHIISRLDTLHTSVGIALAQLDDLESQLEQVELEIINLNEALMAVQPVM